MTTVAKPGLKQAKYTLHPDNDCESPAIMTIDMRANWKMLGQSPPSTLRVAIENINRSIAVLDIWKQYFEQQIKAKEVPDAGI